MGKVEFTIYFLNGVVERHTVDSMFGWEYSAEFLIVNEFKEGITWSTPYCLRDIKYYTRKNIETVH